MTIKDDTPIYTIDPTRNIDYDVLRKIYHLPVVSDIGLCTTLVLTEDEYKDLLATGNLIFGDVGNAH